MAAHANEFQCRGQHTHSLSNNHMIQQRRFKIIASVVWDMTPCILAESTKLLEETAASNLSINSL
jgi:hypothetical protein